MSQYRHDEHPGHACDCPAHRGSAFQGRPGWWSVALAAASCALCPACLATYSKLLSVAGVGVGLTESVHTLLLSVAISASVLVSAWRTIRARRAWPLTIAVAGCILVIVGHVVEALHALEWLGIGVTLIGGLYEHFRLRRARLAPHLV